ncbi:MAG: hypothetical protein KAF91_20300 [Nostoc sp. TH1S01]|nr:hypothetical protein [Nostoc sp. TH1S01]
MSLAGINNRSQPLHPSKAKATTKLRNPINCGFFVGSFIVLSTSSLMIVSSIVPSVTSAISSSNAHPTSIPWINSASQCKHSGRTWHENRCWDDEHSQMF